MVLAVCASGISACWKLSQDADLIAAHTTVAHYLPPLIALGKQSASHGKKAAFLAAQAFLLKAITGRHVANLSVAEIACKQAITYSQRAENVLLYVIALRHLAMIYYYAKRHKEEFALYEYLKPFLSHTAILPIARSFIYTGLAGIQALYQQPESIHFNWPGS